MDVLTYFEDDCENITERCCPIKCGDVFTVSVMLEQTWTVSATGELIEVTDDGIASAKKSLESSAWYCFDCGFEAALKCNPYETVCDYCGSRWVDINDVVYKEPCPTCGSEYDV